MSMEREFETVHRYIRGLDVDDADNNVSLAADDALSRIEVELHHAYMWARGATECGLEYGSQRDALKAALEKIRDTDPEVALRDGECAYCESRTIARRALEEIGE